MILEFESINNIRDLGGIKTADGKRIKEGLLLRSGELSAASDSDISRLKKEYALSDIVDLRDEWEADSKPDNLPDGVKYSNIPAFPPFEDKGELVYDNLVKSFSDDPLGSYKALYRRLAENEHSVEAFSRFLNTVIEARGAVLWHCRQGKDRTGVAAILLLTALGVDEEDIIAEYLETNNAAASMIERLERENASDEQISYAKAHCFVARECVMEYFYAVRRLCGTVMNYLTERIGLTQQEITALREKYLEE